MLVLVFLIFTSTIKSQQAGLTFEHFSVDQGMPTKVLYILQDKTGYLWFATSNGLYKYDGYNFISYKHDIDDTTSLIDNTLTTIYEDKTGTIWVGSYIGLEKFDQIKGTFKHYKPNLLSKGKDASNIINTICEDKNDFMWLGTGDGLYKFNKSNGSFISLRHDSTNPGSISGNCISTIKSDKEGSIWFATTSGLDKLDYKTGKFTHCWKDSEYLNQNWQKISKYWNQALFIDDAGIIWLGTNGGLVEYNPKTNAFFKYPFNPPNPENRITSICNDIKLNILWITSWDELFSFDKKTKKFTSYNSKGNYVLSERSGTIWIGTNSEIEKINLKNQPFKKYSLNEMACAAVNGKDGTIWIYTFSGWKKFDIKAEKVIPYAFGKDELMYVYPTGDLSLLTKNGGFYIQDPMGNVRFSLDPSQKEFNYSLSWGWKNKKGYWVGTHKGGFYLFDPKTKRTNEIRNLKLDINFIYEDSFGSIWISTYMGRVFRYLPERDTLIEFESEIKNPATITGRVINQIYEDKYKELWFVTNAGLNKFERSKNDFTHFTEKDGLPSNNVRGILEDDHGYLWISTTKGISKFDPQHNQFENFDITYGLDLPADAYYGLGCKTENGEMFFPSSKGINRFHPDSVKTNPFIPPIVITSLKKFDKPFPFSNEIHLPYNENFISFEFAALSYISPERNQYAYKMEGLDKDWVYSGTRRYASYPNLDPGEYVFMVKGSNNDGVWNVAGTSILIIISPPWWKSIWAYILYALIIISIFITSTKFYLNRQRLKQKLILESEHAANLEEIAKMKSDFFANISHEFRTPLTLILGPVRQIIERIKDERTQDELKIVHKNANRLLVLVNQLLDISKLESGNMKLQTSPQNIVPIVKVLFNSFCSYAERKKIATQFISQENEIIVYIDRDKFEKIIINVLSNAFKFTPEGGRIEVTIDSSKSPPLDGRGAGKKEAANINYVEVKITDTGIGIPKEKLPKIFNRFYQVDGSHTREQEGTGIGLSLTKELVVLHKGKIEVDSEEGKGTLVRISIPLGNEHLKPEEIIEIDEDEDYDKGKDYNKEKEYDEEKDTLTTEFEEDAKEKAEHKIEVAFFEKGSLPLLLIVEDNSDVGNYIKNNLEKDYRILEARDGEDGWNKSITKIPDLIVSDVMMPKIDGFQLCEKLKTDERTSHIPIILLTAKAASTDKIIGLDLGADDYIMKPFDTNELRARIKNLIEQRKRIHEHFKRYGLFEIEEKNITPIDKKFLQNVFKLINDHLADSSLNVESLARDLALSRSVLQRKLYALLGESPGGLVRRIRIKKAANLIEQKFGNLSQIALEVGYSNPTHFTEAFKKLFGITPSQYQQNLLKNSQ